jgi:hypothetical protein
MAYDPATRTVLLLLADNGGHNASTGMSPALALGETWSWNGTTWTKLSPARIPAPSIGSSMAYDPASGAMLLFDAGFEGTLNETWTLRDRKP